MTGWILEKKQSCHLDAEPCGYSRSKRKSVRTVPVHHNLHYWPALVVPIHAVASKKPNCVFSTKSLEAERAKSSSAVFMNILFAWVCYQLYPIALHLEDYVLLHSITLI